MPSEPHFTPTLQSATAQRVQTWARHAQARELVGRAVRALGPDVEAMPLKGVLLGALGLVHPAERPLRDADLLVRKPALGRAVRALGRAGFRLCDVPWSYGYVSLRHPSTPDLWLDLHVLLMPVGLGRLRPDYMFRSARWDDSLFGARVALPSQRALMVQLLANVVKDRIVQAFEHVPHDLAAVARALSTVDHEAVAADLNALGLRHGSERALAWACGRSADPHLAALFASLVPQPEQRAARLREVAALGALDQGGLWPRIRARAGGDTPWLRVTASAFTAASVVTYPARKAWLTWNNRGDSPSEVR